MLVDNPVLAEYADAAVAAGAPGKDVANWCTGEILGYLNETGLSPEVLPLAPDGLAELIGLVQDGTLSRSLAKDVLDECLREPKRPKQVVEERGLAQVSDEGELGAVVDEVLAANADAVAEYRCRRREGAQEEARLPLRPGHARDDRKANAALLNRLLDESLS